MAQRSGFWRIQGGGGASVACVDENADEARGKCACSTLLMVAAAVTSNDPGAAIFFAARLGHSTSTSSMKKSPPSSGQVASTKHSIPKTGML